MQEKAVHDAVVASGAPPLLSEKALAGWRTAQILLWAVGAAIFLALLLAPEVGIDAFWNLLIPVPPALLAFAPGLWRNVCPLASTALLPRHLGLSARRRLSAEWQGRLGLVAVALLFLIVPLRHVLLNRDGPATALVLAAAALAAVSVGFLFEWKSAWCSGACPVHPVERLYGTEPVLTPPNAHCGPCERCVAPCPDSTPGSTPFSFEGSRTRTVAATLAVGAFPGFVWGWFQVPDFSGGEGWSHLGSVYSLPLAGAAGALGLFLVLRRILPEPRKPILARGFAAAAISCYYWYRIPSLFGMGLFPGDGTLVDLSGSLPSWFVGASRAATTALFFWWFLRKRDEKRLWLVRPPFSPALRRGETNSASVPA